MKIEFHEVPVDRLIKHWVKDYQRPVHDYESYYDAAKGMFILKLYVDDALESGPPTENDAHG